MKKFITFIILISLFILASVTSAITVDIADIKDLSQPDYGIYCENGCTVKYSLYILSILLIINIFIVGIIYINNKKIKEENNSIPNIKIENKRKEKSIKTWLIIGGILILLIVTITYLYIDEFNHYHYTGEYLYNL